MDTVTLMRKSRNRPISSPPLGLGWVLENTCKSPPYGWPLVML